MNSGHFLTTKERKAEEEPEKRQRAVLKLEENPGWYLGSVRWREHLEHQSGRLAFVKTGGRAEGDWEKAEVRCP